MRLSTKLCLAAILPIVLASAQAQTLKPNEVLSSISVRPLSAPNPVAGSDGRTHLAYELLVTNPSHLFVHVDAVDALDQDRAVLLHMDGAGLSDMTTKFSGEDGALPPVGSAAVFMDVALPPGAAVPTQISARLTITRQAAGADGRPAPFPASAPVPATVSFESELSRVGTPAVVVAPPLRGDKWVAINGCCATVSSHRGAIMAVNGLLRVPERFAIDWVQLGADDRIAAGPAGNLSSYRYYGTPVHAVAAGVVVNRYDQAEAQKPGAEPQGITPQDIAGNMLVVDIGGGAFALYAHLQKGSLRAGLGDHVAAGQVLALLGNTGNSTAPHLHFHLMDGPSPLDANGLPFVFERFQSRGMLAAGAEDALEHGAPARLAEGPPRGEHTDQMPLANEVVDFGNPD